MYKACVKCGSIVDPATRNKKYCGLCSLLSYSSRRRKDRDFLEEEARRLYDQGLSDTEIGRKMNWSSYRIKKWRTENSLPRNIVYI